MNADPLQRRREALLSLLGDDDPQTVALVKAQLAAAGPPMLAELRQLEELADPVASFHVRDVIAEIQERSSEITFMQTCRRFGEHGDLEAAEWQLATVLLPGEDFTAARALIDEWGAEVNRRFAKAPTPLDRVETLAEFLHFEQRLRGNDDDYYNVRNSLLPAVIETRLGIPISLALVYQLVGRRAGLHIDGIGLPGHFIVRHEDVFFDPFHGGRRVGLDECRALLEQQKLVLLPQHLVPATPKQMLIRTLTNLYFITEQTNPQLAAKMSEWITAARKS
ncbi:MAG: transglutaminase-like domain-containing protein [Chthoniobacteraceae bacterium]